MAEEFVADTIADVQEMSSYFGSAWIFKSVRLFHLRYVRAAPHNRIRFGARPKQSAPLTFHPNIANILRNLVLEPEHFAIKGLKGCCVPISIVLSAMTRLQSLQPSEITKGQISQGLNSLRFQQFLRQHPPPAGICLSSFRALELANTPLPLALIELFPPLDHLKGLSLNVYRALVLKDPDKDDEPTVYFFPTLLGKNHADPSFFQVDLLIDSSDLRPNSLNSGPDTKKSPLHVLTLIDLAALLARSNPTKRTNASRYPFICRQCCKVFTNDEDLTIHRRICTPFPSGGSCQRRRAKNKTVTRLFKWNPFTKQKEKNGLFFKRSHLYRTLLPLSLSTFDIETLSTPPTDIHPRPGGAERVQTVFAYSLAHVSLYPEHPLPDSLKFPRGLIFDPETQSESSFVISLLKTLREDLRLHSIYLRQSLLKDPGPPRLNTMTPAERAAFYLQTTCGFCGRPFSSTVKKNKDHVHFFKSSRLAR